MKKKSKVIISSSVTIIILFAVLVGILNSKVKYTKEFSYLPQCKEMKLEQSEPGKDDQFGNAVYKVKNEGYDTYLKKYEKVLKKDGWKINKDEKPSSIEAEKDKHILRINVVDSKDSLTVLIWTK